MRRGRSACGGQPSQFSAGAQYWRAYPRNVRPNENTPSLRNRPTSAIVMPDLSQPPSNSRLEVARNKRRAQLWNGLGAIRRTTLLAPCAAYSVALFRFGKSLVGSRICFFLSYHFLSTTQQRTTKDGHHLCLTAQLIRPPSAITEKTLNCCRIMCSDQCPARSRPSRDVCQRTC